MILAFAHPAIIVPDLDLAKQFYCEMFSMTVLSEEGWDNNPEIDNAIGSKNSKCSGYTLAGHNCYIELFKFDRPISNHCETENIQAHEMGIRHIAFYVDDCAYESQRLKQLGGTIMGQPVTFDGGASAVYCRDPFGNIIELCEIPNAEESPINLSGISHLNT